MKLGDNIDRLHECRSKIREYEALIKEIKEEVSTIEELVLAQMKEAGIDSAKGTKASASVNTKPVANVVDWDKFQAFIHRHKAFHLLQRRVSETAWREEVESRHGKAVPGVEAFEKTSLNLRSL